jgi:Pro-kumamolisin, activation domain/Bacterial Ig-like domain (group 3)
MSNRSWALLRTFSFVLLAAFVFSSLSYAVSADRIAGAISAGSGVVLPNSLNRQAQSKYDQGPVSPSFQMSHMILMTTPSAAQQEALKQLLAEQQDRSSRNYHKWLTPAQYADQFGLSPNDMNRLTAWMKSEGFTIISIAGGRNEVSFSGTAAQVQSAFKTEIHLYNVNGEQHFANATPLVVPSALTGIVTGVLGVNNFLMHPTSRFQASNGPRIRANYYDASVGFQNFLAPGDIAVMYDINGLYTGTPAINGAGETIAIVGQTDIFLDDINDFRAGFGLTQISSSNCTLSTSGLITACNDPLFKYVLVPGSADPGQADSISDDLPEADLDIEWSGAVAPGAQVVYINTPSGLGVISSINYALNPPQGTAIPATVVSMSYGACEFHNGNDLEDLLAQGLSEGVTIMSAAGDTGAAACDRNPPDNETQPPFGTAVYGQGVLYPASSPSVIAVGGTAISVADDEDPNQYWSTSNTNQESLNTNIPEIPWNDDEAFAQLCESISDPSGNSFCNPSPGVLINSPQTAQEDVWISAGGGGASNCFTDNGPNNTCLGLAQPTYQSGLTLTPAPTNIPSPATRWVPDISFLSSPNFPGYIICTQLSELGISGSGSACASTTGGASNISSALALTRDGEADPPIFGGTSVASPVFAGMVALLNEYLAGPSSPGLGDIHSMLYSLATANARNGVFNPVTTGDNYAYCTENTPSGQPAAVLCPTSGANAGRIGFSATNLDTATNYNLVAGLGSVNANALAVAWNNTRTTATALTLTPSAAQIYLSGTVTLTAVVTPSDATGNVTFKTGSTVLGTVALAQVSGKAQAQLSTTQLPVGSPDTVSATFNGNGQLPSSQPGTAQVTVLNAFTLSPQTSSYTVTPGQSASVTVTVSTNGSGFTGNLTYTCSDSVSESICTGPALPVSSANAASFTITTTAPTSSSLRSPFDHRFDRATRTFYAMLLPGLLGIFFTFGSRKRSSRGMRILGMILVLGLSTAWMSSCGGSNNSSQNNPGTPAGNYTITITGSSASGSASGATATTTVTLIVQ